MNHFRRSFWAMALLMGSATAHADMGDFMKKLPFGLGASQAETGGKPATNRPAAATREAPPVKPPKTYDSEMAPDVNCSRPREKFDISEKLAAYGGEAASKRLDRLLATDFKYSDLKPEDKKMLQYLAKTTVWVPAGVESKLGSVYDTTNGWFRRKDSMNENEELAFEEIDKRMAKLREAVPDYPAEIRLVLDKKLADGAFARFGGVIQISDRFLSGLGAAGPGADFLLSHEISHVYKRHALKDIQFKMISSQEGWAVAKEVLRGAQTTTKSALDNAKDKITALWSADELVNFVKSVQVRFGKDQEFEADACSTVWLKGLGDDPIKAWTSFHSVLGGKSAYNDEHPPSAERQVRYYKRAQGQTAKAEKSVDAGTVKDAGKKILQGGKASSP